MTAVTQAEFARMQNRHRSYVTQLKKADRLVMVGELVDVEASRARIFDTSDPNREDVKERCEEERTGQKVTVNDEFASKTERELKSERMKYDALSAKMEYERAIGKLIEKADASAAIEDVTSVIRQALENLPHRTAPELVGKDLDGIRATLKQEVHAALADMEREFTKRLNQMGSEE